MNLNDKAIVIIGLGYVGLPLAVELKHREMLGLDIKPGRIKDLRSGTDRTPMCRAEVLREARHQNTIVNPADLARA